MKEPHRCDDGCVCPVHDTPLWYSQAADIHACQDPDCINRAGVLAWGEHE